MGMTLPRVGDAAGPRGPGWWPISQLAGLPRQPRLWRIAGLWVAMIAVSVISGILNVALSWNGVRVELFGFSIDLTIYPAFLLSVLLALWLGPTWGGIAIYCANLASALASGLTFPMSALFALAGAVETLMLWGSLVTLRIDPDLRRWRDLAWFAGASLVAAATGSLAAILWNTSHGLDPVTAQRVWRGWLVGDILQMLLVVAPILFFFGRRLRTWIDRQFVTPPTHELNYAHGVGLAVVGFALLGLVVFLGVHQSLASLEIALDTRTATGELLLPRLREIVLVMGMLSTALIVATGMFSTALARMGERQRREALTDELTGCFNRRSFDDFFHREAERSRRLGREISVLFVDLDLFKAVNDRHGHGFGDVILCAATRRIGDSLRETDLLFRWGGDEFVVLLPHTGTGEAEAIAERIRGAFASDFRLDADRLPVQLGVSIGVAGSTATALAAADLVSRADAACYQAKRAGRNRVASAPAARAVT